MRNHIPHERRRAQRGFSMVELMVALGIGSLLTLVVAQLFSNTRSTNRAQEEAARMQENTRFALDTISRTVRLAGYKSNPTNPLAVFPALTPALSGIDFAAPESDRLIVRHQGGGAVVAAVEVADNSVLNCLGAAVAPAFDTITSAYNRFSIATGADGRNALYCQTDSDPVTGAGPGTELVSGVEAMQVLFGEDTSAPLDSVPDRFIPPGTVTNSDNVVTVRVYLLMASAQGILIGAQTTYTLGGVTYSPAVTDPRDQRLFRVVTTTVALRNRVP